MLFKYFDETTLADGYFGDSKIVLGDSKLIMKFNRY
jgi:hypothetical protein